MEKRNLYLIYILLNGIIVSINDNFWLNMINGFFMGWYLAAWIKDTWKMMRDSK